MQLSRLREVERQFRLLVCYKEVGELDLAECYKGLGELWTC